MFVILVLLIEQVVQFFLPLLPNSISLFQWCQLNQNLAYYKQVILCHTQLQQKKQEVNDLGHYYDTYGIDLLEYTHKLKM